MRKKGLSKKEKIALVIIIAVVILCVIGYYAYSIYIQWDYQQQRQNSLNVVEQVAASD